MSSPKFSEKAAPKRHDALTYRQHFACVWQRFVVANYQSPAHAAIAFGVDPTTAENWFAGTNAPYGWVVASAIKNPTTRAAAISFLSGDA